MNNKKMNITVKIGEIEEFKYLESEITEDGRSDKEAKEMSEKND